MPNALINESSPYLLQHAHNPVNWYPWGIEALQKAREENKPILVSIGYAACHWCHVMERESFEDPATAELMNRFFVNIKIDREERPDLDHIYMDAVQAITGSGGWPLNVFLTPDCRPFYGGTYFPPKPAFNRPSWREVLIQIHQLFQQKREDMLQQANQLMQHLQNANAFGNAPTNATEIFSTESQQFIAEQLLKQADTDWGGFGNAPKFPQTFSLRFLLRHFHFTGYQPALDQVVLSLDKMIHGGIYDQAGGGFARYSTDIRWQIPHFEKMLYDNALLAVVLSEAFQVTGFNRYARVLEETLNFIVKELGNGENGYCSALDADSEGIEGKYYTWTHAQIRELLGSDADWFTEYFQITAEGNWEEVNILWSLQSREEYSVNKGWTETEAQVRFSNCLKKLMEARSNRIRPLLDDKILLGWNALMNRAFSAAFAATGNEEYRKLAIDNMLFMERVFAKPDGSWHHTYKSGESKIPAFLDDYAALIQAYIYLQEITGEAEYLNKALQITQWVLDNFLEESTGFFYYTGKTQTDVVIRKKEVYDGAVPSGNALMASNLQYLSIIFDQPAKREQCRALLQAMASSITRYPGSFGVWAGVLQNEAWGLQEWAVLGKAAKRYLPNLLKKYVPNKILQVTETNLLNFPLLSGKYVPEEEENIQFYRCKDYHCEKPMSDLALFLANV
ncbi:MAG: thioredoxin domain-containing protein [Chitinophagia bacterium]|nr:thioredoxin domain-containing protein [Chitinophagia bacterium]